MNVEQIHSLSEDGFLDVVEGIDPFTAEMVGEVLSVGDLCVLPVHRASRALARDEDIELEDEAGVGFATLCFTKGMRVDDPSALTAWQYAAFLFECSIDDIGTHGPYAFLSDYVIVDSDRIEEYLQQYKDGSPIWGGFSHDEFELSDWQRPSTSIRARASMSPPTDHHKEAFQRYLNANNNFDRFLRLYHTVELLFDFVVFKKIQALGDDLVGYGAVIKDQNRTEVERLTSILLEFCNGPDEIGSRLNDASPFEVTCRTMFQDYSKASNPLKDARFDTLWILVAGSRVSRTNLANTNLANNSDAAAKVIINIAAYWVYRVRCSIAHNRVGEFILTDADDNFVGEFAIPLLEEVVGQMLSNAAFKALTV